jgi:NAD(P)-dependent dehydrogenase (short-subunit alcohol dehydrogenase family)
LTTRNESKALQAKEALTEDPDIDPDNVHWLILDLSDPASVTAAADELKRRETKVDILSNIHSLALLAAMITNKPLVNNAAASTPSRELVDGKYEQHMAAK